MRDAYVTRDWSRARRQVECFRFAYGVNDCEEVNCGITHQRVTLGFKHPAYAELYRYPIATEAELPAVYSSRFSWALTPEPPLLLALSSIDQWKGTDYDFA